MTDEHRYSVEAARAASDRGELDEWVAEFLASPGSDNADLADQLADRVTCWLGPVLLPLRVLHRLAGPPDHPVLEAWDEDEWRPDVENLAEKVDDGWEPPPVVVTQQGEQLVLEDGNHRVEGLRRSGEDETWAVVGFADAAARDRFAVPSEPAPG